MHWRCAELFNAWCWETCFERAYGSVKRRRDVDPRCVGWVELAQEKCVWKAHDETFLMFT